MRLRLRLFEFEDLPWFPAVIRAGMMDYLRFMISALGTYRPIAPLLAEGLRRTGHTHIVELGAGAGGGTETVLAALRTHGQPATTIILTDLYPQPAAWADIAQRTRGAISYEPTAVNALAVPTQLMGFRTIFSAFHHFPPAAATAMLRDAVQADTGIGVFEGAGKHWVSCCWQPRCCRWRSYCSRRFSGRSGSAGWFLPTWFPSFPSAPSGTVRCRCCACIRWRNCWPWPRQLTQPAALLGRRAKKGTGGGRKSRIW